MTWEQSHQRYEALNEVEYELDRSPDGELPWRAEYAAIFGDRHGLLLALRYRWSQLLQAQLDESFYDDDELDVIRRTLVARHKGLLRALHHDADLRRASAPAQGGDLVSAR